MNIVSAVAVFPGPGALATAVWIGAWALIDGLLGAALDFRVRRWVRVHA
jgi:hypothetical protein